MTGKLSDIASDRRSPVTTLPPPSKGEFEREVIHGDQILLKKEIEISLDSRKDVKGTLFIGLPGEHKDGSEFALDALKKGAFGAVVSGNRWKEIGEFARKQGQVAILTDDTVGYLGALARRKRDFLKEVKYVAVTGSAGKTTSKEMISAILTGVGKTFRNPGNYNNLIGLPLSLLMVRKDDRYAVLEIGSNQPGEVALLTKICLPHVGVVTNIGPAHLEGFGGLEGVKKEKGDLFRLMTDKGVVVINNDDLRVRSLSRLHRGATVSYGEKEGDVTGAIISMDPEKMVLSLSYGEEKGEVVLENSGLQFFRNALCAAAVSFALEIPFEKVREGLARFSTPEGRFKILHLGGDLVVVDDTYNANPLSVEVSIDTVRAIFPEREAIYIFGDMLELGDAAPTSHTRIGKLAAASGAKGIYAFGPLSKRLIDGAIEYGYPREKCSHMGDIDTLVRVALREAGAGSVVLVKGSRMMKLEQVVDAFTRHFSIEGKTA